VLTTTYHHPFYDITRSAFIDAVDLHPGDQLQSTDDTTATVETVHPYHQTTVTYDLTINGLHTYYVEAGDTAVLVHNCDEDGTDPSDLGDHTRRDAAASRTNNHAASVAQDTYTGETAYGESGAVPGNVNPQLLSRLQAAQARVGERGFPDWGPGTCAEFHSCNNLLNNVPGTILGELQYYTVVKNNGEPMRSCAWCRTILGGEGGAEEMTPDYE